MAVASPMTVMRGGPATVITFKGIWLAAIPLTRMEIAQAIPKTTTMIEVIDRKISPKMTSRMSRHRGSSGGLLKLAVKLCLKLVPLAKGPKSISFAICSSFL